jgi:hypothetical protein
MVLHSTLSLCTTLAEACNYFVPLEAGSSSRGERTKQTFASIGEEYASFVAKAYGAMGSDHDVREVNAQAMSDNQNSELHLHELFPFSQYKAPS